MQACTANHRILPLNHIIPEGNEQEKLASPICVGNKMATVYERTSTVEHRIESSLQILDCNGMGAADDNANIVCAIIRGHWALITCYDAVSAAQTLVNYLEKLTFFLKQTSWYLYQKSSCSKNTCKHPSKVWPGKASLFVAIA